MEPRDKIFLDTDVTLDHLADRQPFSEYAHRILALAETGELVVCLSSLSFSNLYYLLRKLRGPKERYLAISTPIEHISSNRVKVLETFFEHDRGGHDWTLDRIPAPARLRAKKHGCQYSSHDPIDSSRPDLFQPLRGHPQVKGRA